MKVAVATVVILLIYLTAGLVIANMANGRESHEPAKSYTAVWDWCGVRFPYREDLQEACRWGAYEMLPDEDAPAEKGTTDA